MSSVNDDDGNSSDDNILNWQSVTTKRKKISSMTNVNKKQKSSDAPSCSNVNRFADLADDIDANEDNEKDELAPKPPPIFLSNVTNINKMIRCVESVIDKNEFNYKGLNDGQVKLIVKTVDSYRKITKYFNENNLSYHTYQLKTERAYRFVIKGLHHSSKVEDIKAELLVKGHLVRFITNVKSKFTKSPLPMFYVDIDPAPNNKKVFEIREINHCIVQIEAPKNTDEIVQCHRCQQFGHTKTYCRRPFVCVKCGLGHPTPNCPNDIATAPRCVHCLKQHTANYRGCTVYQTILKKRLAEKRPINHPQFSMNMNDFPHVNTNVRNNQSNAGFNNIYSGETYANVASTNENSTIMNDIRQLLQKQIELTNTLMNMMSLLLNKVCK